MSDVVPPGGDQPVDDVPWPRRVDERATERAAAAAPSRLPVVPAEVPTDVVVPQHWQTITESVEVPPPGYVAATSAGPYARTHYDRWGVLSCVLGVAGIAQLAFVYLPFLSAFAISMALTGRRYARLDPDGVQAEKTSMAGLVLGIAGVVFGLALWYHYRTLSSLVDA